MNARTKSPKQSRYSLRKGLGMWELTFNGQNAILKHEQGLAYVAYLLLNPPAEPIHALDLATRIAAMDRKNVGLAEIVDPVTGKSQILESHARLQERSLGLDNAQVMRGVLRQQAKLEAVLEDPDQIEPVKSEASRELIDLYTYERKYGAGVRDSAAKASDAVGRAIKRLYQHLSTAKDGKGRPNQILQSFAEFIRLHVLLPSGRAGGHGGVRPINSLGGSFFYEAPPGVSWSDK
jgi:hypothetical protein